MPGTTSLFQRGLLATLFGITLTACNTVAGPLPQPTSVSLPPTAVAVATSVSLPPTAVAVATPIPPLPTTAAPLPTLRPTAVPASNPVIAFSPQDGAPGTPVNISGSGFTPGAPVVVRLGLPRPTGEALASAFADSTGRWATTLVIPDRLPSGELISTSNVFLVAMSDNNLPLASAPFGFEPATIPQPAGTPSQAVRDFLGAYASGGDAAVYLDSTLRAQLTNGRPLHAMLGLHPIALESFTVYKPDDRPSEVLFVGASLAYSGFVEERTFTLVVENGEWRINGSSSRP